MIQTNTPTDNRAVSPVVGVILLVAISLISAIILGLVILFGGMAIIDSYIDLTPYLSILVALWVAADLIEIYRKRRKRNKATIEDSIEFSEEFVPINDADIDTEEIHIVKASVDEPDNTYLSTPLTVAPKHANPRNWTLPTRLSPNNEVQFVINTGYTPTKIESNDALLAPNTLHGQLNAQYDIDEIDALTVYDANLNEVTTYELTNN